jgi:hypothetical protein
MDRVQAISLGVGGAIVLVAGLLIIFRPRLGGRPDPDADPQRDTSLWYGDGGGPHSGPPNS